MPRGEARREADVGRRQRLWTGALVSASAVALILVQMAWPERVGTITLGLLGVAALPWLLEYLESAEFPGGWKVQVRQLEVRQQQQRRELDVLKLLIRSTVTPLELDYLKKLAAKEEFRSGSGPQNDRDWLVHDLRHMRDLGFIENRPGMQIMGLQQENVDVHDYVRVKEEGRKFLTMREETETWGKDG